jgi:hypothetical protein
MLLGNKCDVTPDNRVITLERGEQLATSHGITFMETSALSNINIEKAFTTLTEEILLAVCPPAVEETVKNHKGKKK